MAKFLLKSLISTIITLFLVSAGLFFLVEVGSGDIALKVLGIFSTPDQRISFRAQLGLDAPAWQRYLDWLIGSDWRAQKHLSDPLKIVPNFKTRESEWWVDLGGGRLARWQMQEEGLTRLERNPDGSTNKVIQKEGWKKDAQGRRVFWGVDNSNSAAMWVKGVQAEGWNLTEAGSQKVYGVPQKYIPLRKGLLRGDPGMSLQYKRPVSGLILPRIRNTVILAGAAFVIVMPIALFLGILAGINEGRWLDRIISVTGLGITAIPEFVTGIFLILIFGVWLKALPAVTLFTSSTAIFENPTMLVLPVLTLSAIELGYVARMTRASMVEVMDSDYIRTAVVKGMPYWRVVLVHAIRNALMAPVTVMMLHVNWMIGGVVVTEIIFGYPGLGKFIYDAALFGDFSAIEAAAMVTVCIAIGTRLVGDMVYTLLNPRIRYA